MTQIDTDEIRRLKAKGTQGEVIIRVIPETGYIGIENAQYGTPLFEASLKNAEHDYPNTKMVEYFINNALTIADELDSLRQQLADANKRIAELEAENERLNLHLQDVAEASENIRQQDLARVMFEAWGKEEN